MNNDPLRSPSEDEPDEDEDIPTIDVSPHEQHRVNQETRLALRGARNLAFYQRGNALVHVVFDVDDARPAKTLRPVASPTIRSVGPATLSSELTRIARWRHTVRRGKSGTPRKEPCGPPAFVVNHLLEAGTWPVPRLAGIVEAPVILPSGRVLQAPGYDAESELLYCPPAGSSFPPIPDEPCDEDIALARELLREAVCDFPFESDVHRAAWLAGVLSYFARWAYSGPTPLFLVDGNVRGSGKGKLVNLAASICLGRKPMLAHQTGDDKAEKELITAVALSGEMMVLIDNISRPFGSAPLDSALTETVWSQILKYNNDPTQLPLYAIWWATGNNVQFRKHSDTVRRTLRIRLDSPHERPEQREGFRHPDLDAWARANRRHLVWAALTLLRGFHQAGGRAEGLRTWGSFEGWSRLVRGALVWMGESDPHAAAAMHDDAADPAVEALGGLLQGWRELCRENKVEGLTVQEALAHLQLEIDQRRTDASYRSAHERLIGAVCTLCPPKVGKLPDGESLGYKLRMYKQRSVGGLRLETAEKKRHGCVVWIANIAKEEGR